MGKYFKIYIQCQRKTLNSDKVEQCWRLELGSSILQVRIQEPRILWTGSYPWTRKLHTDLPENLCGGLDYSRMENSNFHALYKAEMEYSDIPGSGLIKRFSRNLSFAHSFTILEAWQMGGWWHGEASRICCKLMIERRLHPSRLDLHLAGKLLTHSSFLYGSLHNRVCMVAETDNGPHCETRGEKGYTETSHNTT